MSHLTPLSPRRLMQLLEREGFSCIRIRGSHHFFLHADGRTTMVPVHGGKDVGVGLIRTILREVSWSVGEFQKRLGK